MVVSVTVAVLVLAVLPPLLHVGRELMDARSSFALLGEGRLWSLLGRSAGLSSVITILAVAVGVPLGVLFARASVPLRRLLLASHLGVVFLPPFLPALGWFHLFGREGFWGGAGTSELLFSEFGVVFVLVACFTPAVTALTALGVSGVDASLEEAARLAGGTFRAAALVLVPCAAPVIALAGLIVFTLAFSELGVPMFLRVDVYPAVVFARLGGMDFAPGEAAVFVLPLVLVATCLLGLERRLAGRRAIFALGVRAQPRMPLFECNLPTLGIAVIAATVSLLPVAALAIRAGTGRGLPELSRWTGGALWNGLRAAALAALVMTALALVLGRSLAREGRVAAWLDGLATLSFILPSSILGIGIMGVWNRPATSWLYAGYGVLILGFVARYSGVATRTFAAAVAQIPPSLEDAARTVGAGYLRRLWLLIGLGRRGLLGTFALGLVLSLRDLETVALFYPPGGEPLTVRIFTLEANGPPAVVSALALLQVFVTLAAVALAWLALRPRAREATR